MNQPSGSMAKPSRYRQAREDSTTVDDMNRPATSSTASDTNPTIARSMSRYRRRRPGAESSPAIPGAALATSRVAVPASRHARHQSDAEEEHLREKHRLDAMDQLTGGNPKSRPSTRPPSIEKSARRSLTTENGTSTVQSRETTQECRAKPDPSTDPADRKSFFQKVGLGKPKGASAKDQASPRYIGVGGGGIVPGTDAPVSAVNAGKRHVLVQYGNVSLWFPFTPSTRASDILRSASKTLSSEINPDTFILVETFRQIGLDRPLRRYEHIREIMNSWSQDADGNRLTVIPPSSMDIYARLDAQHVPLERPGETTVLMYYSHRPRRWDKRFVTLRTDGQVTMAKKETSKDSTNICHLSDYDIYTPSARAAAKDIKPPKRFCLAIKSQQKSTMFLSTDNFVHFFSTSDRAVADEWHHAVQQWRSWYLINELGAILPTEETASPKGTSTQRRGAQRPTYESPLVDQIPGDGSPPLRTAGISQSTSAQDLFSRKKSTREHPAPPTKPFHETIAINTRVDKHPGPAPPLPGMSPEEEPETFSPTGLLGRTYTQRRAAMQEREEREKREKQDPWLYPSGAMIPEMPSHPNGAPTAKGPRGRSESIGQSNRPLVDLTPVFREPPQHTRKGRGVTIEAGRQLIEGATGPDLTPGAMPIPSAQAWRRPPAPPIPTDSSAMPMRSNTVRSTRYGSQPKRTDTSSADASPVTPGGPFIPNTLLAPSKQRAASYDQTPKSRRGMQDIALENPFADGGLLHQA